MRLRLHAVLMWSALTLLACPGGTPSGNNNEPAEDAATPALCGNGEQESGEACDDGVGNSDSLPDACRTDCRQPSCGDGVVDSGESCDEGQGNSDRDPNACRTNCTTPSCGDGVIDEGEACDAGEDNSDTAPGACRTGCQPADCGDGIFDPGQVCYDYWGVAAPQGYMSPVSLNGDSYRDLVGPANHSRQTLLASINEGGAFHLGRGYLTPRQYRPEVPVGELFAAGSRVAAVVGEDQAVLVESSATGRLALPVAQTLDDQHLSIGDRFFFGLNTPTAARYLGSMTFSSGQYCRVPLDASGLLTIEAKDCWPLPANFMEIYRLNMGTRLGTIRPLPSTDGSFRLAVPSGRTLGVLRLDNQGALVGTDEYPTSLGQWTIHVPELLPLMRGNSDLYWLIFDSDRQLSYARWNDTSHDFALPHTVVPITVWKGSFSGNELYAFGEFGGSGILKDMLFKDGQRVILVQYVAGSYDLLLDCDEGEWVQGVWGADLDGDGDDEVLFSTEYQLTILWNDSGISCTGRRESFPLPGSVKRAQLAPLTGDAHPDLFLSTLDAARSSFLLTGGSSPSMEKLNLSADILDLRAFPNPADPQRSELVFLSAGLDVDEHESVAILRHRDGRMETGYPVMTRDATQALRAPVKQRLVGDVNGDGQEDLLLVLHDRTLRVFIGPYDRSLGGFVSESSHALPYVPGEVLMADLNGDGLPEALLTRSGRYDSVDTPDDYISVLPNVGGQLSASVQRYQTVFDPVSLAVGDFDDDGDQDVVSVHSTSGLVSVLVNDGSGVLSFDSVFLIPGRPVSAQAVDFDGDGWLDLAVLTPDHGLGPIWLRGLGDGHFLDAVDLNITASEFVLEAIDMTGDGRPDLVLRTLSNGEYSTVVMQAEP